MFDPLYNKKIWDQSHVTIVWNTRVTADIPLCTCALRKKSMSPEMARLWLHRQSERTTKTIPKVAARSGCVVFSINQVVCVSVAAAAHVVTPLILKLRLTFNKINLRAFINDVTRKALFSDLDNLTQVTTIVNPCS